MEEKADENVHAFRAIAAAALTLAAGLAGPVAAADMTADQILAASGVTNDTSFCGTKNITLGIHDGVGINGWSKSSMAAVRSEAAKCPNVKQVVRIGQGDLQKSISDVNGLVAEGIDALVIIPDFGKAQLPSLKRQPRPASGRSVSYRSRQQARRGLRCLR